MNKDLILLKGVGGAFLLVSAVLIFLGIKALDYPQYFEHSLILIPFGVFILLIALMALFDPKSKFIGAIMISLIYISFGSAFLLLALYGKSEKFSGLGRTMFFLFFIFTFVVGVVMFIKTLRK